MKKKDSDEKGNGDEKSLEILVIEQNAQVRITYELARQLEPHLPIASFEKITKDLREVVVDKHRLPLKMFAPHISDALFPIENVEDLVRKLSAGVQNAIALARGPSFQIRNKSIAAIVATSLQGEPGRRSAIPVGYYTGASPLGSTLYKGGK